MVLLKRLEWYSSKSPETPVLNLSPMTDIIDITARKGVDLKNNICDIELKNPFSKYVDDGEIMFKENDILKLYIKDTTDASDVGTEWWTEDELISYYYIEEYNQTSTSNRHRIKLSAVDRAFVLFNKVYANSYGSVSDQYWTSPGIFRSVVRINASRDGGIYSGTDTNPGIELDIDAKFVSEGGHITDYRADTSTTLNGAIDSDDTEITLTDGSGFPLENGTIVIGSEHIYYATRSGNVLSECVRAIDDTVAVSHLDTATTYLGFPTIDLALIWKPIYEWLSELGQVERTNFADEIETEQYVYNRAFITWIDKNNKIHWIPATNDVDVDLVLGDDELYEVSLDKSVFDAVNMVIYNVGADMNGVGKNWYFYDMNSDVTTLKMRYQPMTDKINTIYNKELTLYPSRYATTATTGNKEYPTASYPLSEWSFKNDSNLFRTIVRGQTARTTLTNDSDYNKSLEEAAFWAGRQTAQSITQKLAGLRYKGTITLRGRLINPGDLIRITDPKTGVSNQLLRVLNVTQNIGKSQFSTTLDVEEDERTLG